MPTASWMPSPAQLEEARSPRVSNAKLAGRWGVNRATVSRVRAGLGIVMTRQGVAEGYVPGEDDGEADDAGEGAGEAPSALTEAWEHVPFDSDVWRAYERLQEQDADPNNQQREVSITLEDNLPVLVLFLADVHLGHEAVPMGKLRSDLEAIRNTPGCYVIYGGDMLQNTIATKAGRGTYHEDIMAIRKARRLVEQMTDYVGPQKALAYVDGNHDQWTAQDADWNLNAYLAVRSGCAFLGDTGYLHLTLGQQTYDILASHQYRMRSSFNVTHQAKRLEDAWGDADVIFTGHTHDPGAESAVRRQARHFYGQAGSYQLTSRYAAMKGYPPTRPDMPACVIFPDQHKVVGFGNGFEDAFHALWSYRQDFPCQCSHCRGRMLPES